VHCLSRAEEIGTSRLPAYDKAGELRQNRGAFSSRLRILMLLANPRSLVLSALAGCVLLAAGGCAQLPERPPLPAEAASPVAAGSALDRMIAPKEDSHPGQSGFRLVGAGPEAFAVRASSAAKAERSIDVQTYIWHGDMTGLALARVLLEAADRGVRVRLLLDDMDARAKNDGLAALDAHPNIEVRMFNPLASRSGTLAMLGDLAGSGQRLNHRMHNKTWIADNRIAIVGGRNLGDEYFGASEEVNFVDLDFAMVGPVVRDASQSFDKYWNSPSSYPIALLSPDEVDAARLETVRTHLDQAMREALNSHYAELLKSNDAIQRLTSGHWPMEWSGEYRFVSDDPSKALQEPDASNSNVLAALQPVLAGAEREMSIVSPYFVPRSAGTEFLVGKARAGQSTRILTNSLAANDVAAVHGGYAEYRDELLAGGVQLWELKPLPGVQTRSSFFGSGGASLHTKGLEVDGETLFVGSYNLDPRSTSLNCEQGVLVKSPVLAKQFRELFDRQTAGTRAWQVTLVKGDLQWSDGKQVFDDEPDATAGRKFQAWLAKLLPVEAQL
jgi:putative cardiolipin synthase